MYETILIPTDGSEPAERAAEQGVKLASELGSTVHVVYAVEPVPLGGFTSGPEPASAGHREILEEQKTEGQNAIDAVAELCAEYDVDVVEAIEFGNPHEEILEYAESEGIGAIVMGTHGRSGAKRMVLGSVTEKVVRKSPVPVLTVRTGS